MSTTFETPTILPLPDPVMDLYRAQIALKAHFSHTHLAFTLDGKLVGDIAEAIVAETYELDLCSQREHSVDARTKNTQKSVQIKSTSDSKAGPSYSTREGCADYLIFVSFDFQNGHATVIYNGPEAPVRQLLPKEMKSTVRLSRRKVENLDALVAAEDRLSPKLVSRIR